MTFTPYFLALFREEKILKATANLYGSLWIYGLVHNHDLVIVSTADINEGGHHVSIVYCCTTLISQTPQTRSSMILDEGFFFCCCLVFLFQIWFSLDNWCHYIIGNRWLPPLCSYLYLTHLSEQSTTWHPIRLITMEKKYIGTHICEKKLYSILTY